MKATTAAAIGWFGTILFVIAYSLVSLGFLAAQHWPYQALNSAGALLIGINALHNKAKAIVILEIFWITVGIIAIMKTYLL
jgi:hypothetical protein